jgi:hypothetical protein
LQALPSVAEAKEALAGLAGLAGLTVGKELQNIPDVKSVNDVTNF